MRTLLRSDLRPELRRIIKRKESILSSRCVRIWSTTNRLGETILYGRFLKNRERTIVTLGQEMCGKMVPIL